MPDSLVIRSTRIVADGAIRPGAIHIRGGKIERIDFSDHPPVPKDARAVDAGNLVILPGLVDTHVHVNEPGRTDWEGFETAGRAAAAGGITTIVVMPLNCTPAATNVPALLAEAAAASGKCLVDYGLWGGLIPGNTADLELMWNAGALGFKAFMVDSGVPDFPAASQSDLRAAAPILGRLNAPLLVHAEDPGVIERSAIAGLSGTRRSYRAYLASRPPEAEDEAIRFLLGLCELHRVRIHVVHITSVTSTVLLAGASRATLPISGETCPHYLTFAAEEIPDGATEYKCAPPIRDSQTRASLWDFLQFGLKEGRSTLLNMIVSDHSPCPPELKHLDDGDFSEAWGGISSLQLGLSAVWTGIGKRGDRSARVSLFSRGTDHWKLPDRLSPVVEWMSRAPAELAGLAHRKGRIAPGYDADLIFFDPDEEWTVRGSRLYHRWKLTPYDGLTLRGVVKRTILRGQTIFDASLANPFPTRPIGNWLKRSNS